MRTNMFWNDRSGCSTLSMVVARTVTVLIVTAATTAWAVVQGIHQQPASIVIGDGATLSSDEEGNTDPIASYKWERQRVFVSGCTTGWLTIGTDHDVDVQTSFPTDDQYKLTVTYKKISQAPPPSLTVHTHTIKNAPADGIKVDSGSGVVTANGGAIALWYQVTSGAKNCGGYLAGTAQERLINQSDIWGNELPDSPGWFPITPTATFYLVASRIYDEHAVFLTPANWATIPVGGFAAVTQLLRLSYTDSCGNVEFNDLGSAEFFHEKVSETDWKLISEVN